MNSTDNPQGSAEPLASRLSRIDTLWSVVRQAHADDDTETLTAQQQLLTLYSGAIRRYLTAALRDPNQVEDVFQDFAVKFLRGEFRSVDPAKGRFRSFVKTVLFRMVAQQYRVNAKRREQPLDENSCGEPPESSNADQDERQYLASWREDLLARTWQGLSEHEQSSGVPYYTILQTRVADPTLSSEKLAQQLTSVLGKPVTAGSSRTMLHRAREKFAQLMIEAVAQSLEAPTREAIEQELVELQLIGYCRQAMDSLN